MDKIISGIIMLVTVLSAACMAVMVWVGIRIGQACWRRWGPGRDRFGGGVVAGNPLPTLDVQFRGDGCLRISDGGHTCSLRLAGVQVPPAARAGAERAVASWIGEGSYRLLHLAAGDDLVRGSASLVEHLVAAGWAVPASGPFGARYREGLTLARARQRGLWGVAHA